MIVLNGLKPREVYSVQINDDEPISVMGSQKTLGVGVKFPLKVRVSNADGTVVHEKIFQKFEMGGHIELINSEPPKVEAPRRHTVTEPPKVEAPKVEAPKVPSPFDVITVPLKK